MMMMMVHIIVDLGVGMLTFREIVVAKRFAIFFSLFLSFLSFFLSLFEDIPVGFFLVFFFVLSTVM